ncbi:MAG TPA: hypothetical protein VIN62_03800, partial [Candidatus Cryosericum sp.]
MQAASYDLLLRQTASACPGFFGGFAELAGHEGSIAVSTPSRGFRQLLIQGLLARRTTPLVVLCESSDAAEELATLVRTIPELAAGAPSCVVLPELGV